MEQKNSIRDSKFGLATGINKVDISLDELNFCLERDKSTSLLDVGLVRRGMGPFKTKAASVLGSGSGPSGAIDRGGGSGLGGTARGATTGGGRAATTSTGFSG